MRLIKTINKPNEIVKLYNQPLDGGVSVKMNGRQYWMVTIKKDFRNENVKNNSVNAFKPRPKKIHKGRRSLHTDCYGVKNN